MVLDLDSQSRLEVTDRADLVFDFAGKQSPDLGALCLMLTARMLADESHQRVWLHALPEPTWRLLHVLGLEHLFELLPHGGRVN